MILQIGESNLGGGIDLFFNQKLRKREKKLGEYKIFILLAYRG